MNGYSTLWTHVSFHVPQDTTAAKTAARKFIKTLRLKCSGMAVVVFRGDGAGLLCCRFDKACELLSAALPPDSELKLVPVTDKQIEHSRNFYGKRRTSPTAA